jgi:RND family efflux transporter MFP subunit
MNDLGELHIIDRGEPALPPALGSDARKAGAEPARGHRGARRAGIAAVVILASALGYGAGRHALQDDGVAAAAERQREFVPSVRTAPVRPAGATVSVTLPATTSAFETANIFARATGYIATRKVDIGDHVKAGQLLAEVTAPELDHQIAQNEANLAQLRAALQQAQANRDLANSNWSRDKPLVEKGWVTPQQGDNDRLTLAAQNAAVGIAQANVKQQQAQLMVLGQQKDYQRVVAPFDGVITQRNIDVGTLVQADAASGTFMFTVMRSNELRIQLFVPQSEAFGISPGVEAVIRVPEIPDRTFPGKVTRAADALQPGTRTLLTEIDVPNPDEALSPGTYCTVELRIPRKTPALLVSADAIIFNGEGLHVAVVEDGVAHLRKIEIARDFGREVEVRDGVRDGDQVILNPSADLADGAKVRIRPEQPAPTS